MNVHFLLSMCLKIDGRVANRVHPDQSPRSLESDLGLYCLFRPSLSFDTIIIMAQFHNDSLELRRTLT